MRDQNKILPRGSGVIRHNLIAFITGKSWKLRQMDAKSAFLHGYLNRATKKFENKAQPSYVCKLKKNFVDYSFQFNVTIHLLLHVRACLIVKAQGGKLAIRLVYVDDLIIIWVIKRRYK